MMGSTTVAGDSTPRVSICIPTYNQSGYLGAALQSALDQSYDNYEIVIVDDGSTDNTAQVVERFPSDAIRYFYQENAGEPAARNLGIAQATGEFILWLDSDDVLMPGALAGYGTMLRQVPDTDVLYGDLILTDEQLHPRYVCHYEDWYGRSRELLASFLSGNSIPQPGTMVRKLCYEQIGGYDISFLQAGDYEWWTRLSQVGKFKHSGIVVVNYRWHGRNASSTPVEYNTGYGARVVHKMLARYRLTDLYLDIDWERLPMEEAEAIAYLRTIGCLLNHKDISGALSYAQKGCDYFLSDRAGPSGREAAAEISKRLLDTLKVTVEPDIYALSRKPNNQFVKGILNAYLSMTGLLKTLMEFCDGEVDHPRRDCEVKGE
jgi:glycosyltransferase involved in cell wall biosynthesis